MPDLLATVARRLGCTRGQAATVLIGLAIAVPTLVSTVVGVEHHPSSTVQQEQP